MTTSPHVLSVPELGILSLAIMVSLVHRRHRLVRDQHCNLTGILAALILTRATAADVSAPGVVMCVAVRAPRPWRELLSVVGSTASWSSRLAITPSWRPWERCSFFMGIALVITRGHAVADYPKVAQFIGNGTLAGVPVP